MNPATIYYLLFLMLVNVDEGPIGIYQDRSSCERDGKEVTAVIGRKYICRPATQAAIQYLTGKCLGDQQLCAHFLQSKIVQPKENK